MSRGMSLQAWHAYGLLDREMAVYRRLVQHIMGITVFTYGGRTEQMLADHYPSTCVLPAYLPRGKRLYELYGPLLRQKELRKCNIFKTNQIKGAGAAVRAKRLTGKPLIVRCGYVWSDPARYHDDKQRRRILRYEKKCFAAADAVITTSSRNRQLILETHQLEPRRVHVIPNYVDLPWDHEKTEREPGTVLFTGRLTAVKNIELLLEAVEQAQHVQRLTIVGDGPLLSMIRQRAASMHTRVELPGRLPHAQLHAYYKRAQVFVLPSRYEGAPKSLLEAMGHGMACIGTDVAGIRDVIEHGQNGLLCTEDADALAAGMSRLLADAGLCARLGTQAHGFIRDNYSLERVVELELELIRKLADCS